MSLKVKLNKSVNQIIKDSGINDRTALYAAYEARGLMRDYVPMNTGALCNTTRIYAENNKGTVLYMKSYARFCYYGGAKKFSRDKHEKASAYWDIAMGLANKGVLTKRVREFLGRK